MSQPPPAAAGRVGRVLSLAHPDWLQHTLTVRGAVAELTDFRQAAAGAGVVPWVFDYDRMEEDWYHLLLAPPPPRRAISTMGARILARQLREAVWDRHEHAVSMVGVSRACPFDLHALVPVPREILSLGEDHPRSMEWLWDNWGTTWALRHVEELPALPEAAEPGAFRVAFWSADWSPWRALSRLADRWPRLSFDLQPRYR